MQAHPSRVRGLQVHGPIRKLEAGRRDLLGAGGETEASSGQAEAGRCHHDLRIQDASLCSAGV
jgi:hypothetical protein